MRCTHLASTWADLCAWFDKVDVLVLPPLERGGPVVRLDADVAQTRSATPEERDRVLDRLRAVIERLDVRAVYVNRTTCGPATVWSAADAGEDTPIITIRLVAGGIDHELTLVAAWYADLLDRTAGAEFTGALQR